VDRWTRKTTMLPGTMYNTDNSQKHQLLSIMINMPCSQWSDVAINGVTISCMFIIGHIELLGQCMLSALNHYWDSEL
jgi:hypothetical protein